MKRGNGVSAVTVQSFQTHMAMAHDVLFNIGAIPGKELPVQHLAQDLAFLKTAHIC